jgi:hypothetical protein
MSDDIGDQEPPTKEEWAKMLSGNVTELPEEQNIQEIANIPVVFVHYALGEQTMTTAMPQIPAVGESVHFDNDTIPIGTVFHVRWCYTNELGRWHAEVAIR